MFGFSFIDKYINHVFIPIGFKKFYINIFIIKIFVGQL